MIARADRGTEFCIMIKTIGSHLVTFDRGFMRLLGRTELTVLKPA